MNAPRASKTGIKPGDWVRVLKNDQGALSPHQEGHLLAVYDGVKVRNVEDRRMPSGDGDPTEVIVYLVGKTRFSLPVTNVEPLVGCVCAGPVVRNLGCRCGYAQMMAAEAIPKPSRPKNSSFAGDLGFYLDQSLRPGENQDYWSTT